MDERTVPASQFFDAQTLGAMRAIQETLSKIDIPAIRIDPHVLAGVQANIVAPAQAAAMADAVARAGQFDGVLRAMKVSHLPAIVEQISATLLANRQYQSVLAEISMPMRSPVDTGVLSDAIRDGVGEDDELDATVVEEQFERILDLDDYQAEQLAISLGLALDKVPARVAVVLVMSLMVVLQIAHPRLFDSLMNGKRNWAELFQGAARYWG